MPWTGIDESSEDWPIANEPFDPLKGTELYRTYLDEMAFAEECGFDWVGCNEHHFSPYGLMANCNLIGAALAQTTSRVKLAMFGNLIPLLNPVRIAEEYAMLDVMSGGRLVAGFMRGIAHEYAAYNVPPDDSWSRLKEAYELIVRAWTEPEPFRWEGQHYQFRSVSIWPRPLQRPHPSILMSGGSVESAEFAGQKGAIMGIVQLTTLEAARQNADVYRAAAKASGWEPSPDCVLVGLHACIADSDE